MSEKKSLEEGLRETAARSGAIGDGSNPDGSEPKIRSFTMVPVERDVRVGDTVLVHMNTPINGLLDVEGEVTKLNANNGTINVDVKNTQNGVNQAVDSVKNFIPQDRSPWWSWPEQPKQESSARKKS